MCSFSKRIFRYGAEDHRQMMEQIDYCIDLCKCHIIHIPCQTINIPASAMSSYISRSSPLACTLALSTDHKRYQSRLNTRNPDNIPPLRDFSREKVDGIHRSQCNRQPGPLQQLEPYKRKARRGDMGSSPSPTTYETKSQS